MFEPRFVGRVSTADVVTLVNAMLGFVACAFVLIDPTVSAQAILLAAVADGLDGVLARKYGSTPIGEYLDSLSDVASFSVAPALFVTVLALRDLGGGGPWGVAAVVVPAVFVAMAVVRLGLYTAMDVGKESTEGVQTTLAATIIAVLYLAGVTDARVLLVLTAVFAYLMVTRIPYPELYARDAIAMGAVQAGAILAPTFYHRVFPRALLVAAACYLVGGPFFYWRRPERNTEAADDAAVERDPGAGVDDRPTDGSSEHGTE